MISLLINDTPYEIDIEQDTPLLWVIRDNAGLTGTKFGCGTGLCGTCTVHLDDVPVRSCVMPVSSAIGKRIVTIEGLASSDLHPVQQAWLDESASECGYCQPGQIMSAAALLKTNPNPTKAQIDSAMNNNLCRCGMYQRIGKAIKNAANRLKESNENE